MKNNKVVVVGSGVSGLSTAIFLSKFNFKVELYTDKKLGFSSSLMAQSGFRAGGKKDGGIEKNNFSKLNKYFEDWLIDLLDFLPEIFSILNMNLDSFEKSSRHIDGIDELFMYSCKKGNIGPLLIKFLISELKKIDNIQVYENSRVIPIIKNNLTEFKVIKSNKIIKNISSEKIILAIGGDLGSGFYGSTSNMSYSNYDLHNVFFNNLKERKIQCHPFGFNFRNNFALTLPEIYSKNGFLITKNDLEKKSLNNFKSRKECVQWIYSQKQKIFLKLSKDNENKLPKKYNKFFTFSNLYGNLLEIKPVSHYLLKAEFKTLPNIYRVGEFTGKGFRLDRPAGMGITHSLLTGFQVAKKIVD